MTEEKKAEEIKTEAPKQEAPKQMTKEQALTNVSIACAGFQGTWKEHMAMQQALAVLRG